MNIVTEIFKNKTTRLLIIAGPVVLALAIVLPFCSAQIPIFVKPTPDLIPYYANAQLAVTAVSFFIILLALCFTIVQVRKSMAKPLIKVAFNEKGEQQATLNFKDGKHSRLPDLWLINEGNAISRYFQIDFIIPENIGKQSKYVHISRDGKYIIPNTNDGKYTLFVNRPYSDSNIHLSPAIDTNKAYEVNSFEIEYRIYGDWAETQEGKLKVKINKQ